MNKRKTLAVIDAVLFAIDRRADIDAVLVDAYIVVGGKSLGTMTIRQTQNAIRIAVDSIDLDTIASRRRILTLASKKQNQEEAPL